MTRLVKNPDFRIVDVLEGAKGEFSCTSCGNKFKAVVQRFEDGGRGFVCPKCGLIHKLKA